MEIVEREVRKAIRRAFGHIVRVFRTRVPFKKLEELEPDRRAIYDALQSFPWPVDVTLVDVDVPRPRNSVLPPVVTILSFDFTAKGDVVIFHGRLAQSRLLDEPSLVAVVSHNLIREDRAKDFGGLCWLSYGDHEHAVFTLHANVIAKPEQLADTLFEYFWSRRADLINKFKKVPNWNELYALKPDPIRSLSELTTPGQDFFESLQADGTMRADRLDEWQRRVAHIQLIPKVPEDVLRNFSWTKLLYVYSYFEYALSTIARHYLYLTVESAMKRRWILTLPTTVTIQDAAGVTSLMPRSSHHGLAKVMRKAGKGATLEGVPFPRSLPAVIHALQARGLIEAWERRALEFCAYFRNVFSHREHGSVHGISPADIEEAADLINRLFHAT